LHVFTACFCCFFFQAEDGIRDFHVTGVQTCALPIFDYDPTGRAADVFQRDYLEVPQPGGGEALRYPYRYLAPVNTGVPSGLDLEIGRASCRERVEIWVGAVSCKSKESVTKRLRNISL